MPYKDKEKQKTFQHNLYLKNKVDVLRRNQDRRKALRAWMREFLKDKSCLKCKENDRRCLDFHHKDAKTKKAAVARLICDMRSKKMILEEIKKCIILCSNCHRKHHIKNEIIAY